MAYNQTEIPLPSIYPFPSLSSFLVSMVLNLAKSPLSSIYPCIFLFQCLFHSILLLSFTFPWLRTSQKPHLAIHPSPFPHYFTLHNRNGQEGGGRWVGRGCLPNQMAESQVIYLFSHPSIFRSASSSPLSYFQCHEKGKEQKGTVYLTIKHSVRQIHRHHVSLLNRGIIASSWQCI